MDRARWCSDDWNSSNEEYLVIRSSGVRLYDGAQKLGFENGFLTLTTHRIIWCASENSSGDFIAIPLAAILRTSIEDVGVRSLVRTPKIVLHLLTQPALENALAALAHSHLWMDRWYKRYGEAYAVVGHSTEDHIKLGFTATGVKEFYRSLEETLQAKPWAAVDRFYQLHSRVGIAGMERQLAAEAHSTDFLLEDAFTNLDRLISQAGEIVSLSRALARKNRDTKNGKLTTDETTELRAIMLSMGIEENEEEENLNDRSSDASSQLPTGASNSFHSNLARQISDLLTPILTAVEKGQQSKYRHMGTACIDLASAYCRINRARGMQLISPEEMVKACRLLERENLPLRLKRFPSGVLMLHLASENEEETLEATAKLVEELSNLTAAELARAINLSPILAQERLLALEERGFVCRDDTETGLRFYPNLFRTRI